MSSKPLAERMRPRSLEAVLGQDKLLGKGGSLSLLVQKGILPSMIFWGPPGTGKTTIAKLLAEAVGRKYFELSAINSGVKEVREVIQKAEDRSLFSGSSSPVLFIDEIHRFSKSQQDSLLGAVERGSIVLIGATTENPSFEVIPALRSRCQLYILESLGADALKNLLQLALKEDPYLKERGFSLKEADALLAFSGGDARKLLNTFELIAGQLEDGTQIDNAILKTHLQTKAVQYDKGGEEHYNVISAFIKSIRGSDPNAAVYWLARMVEGGEDPKFIARRMIISASEDIGLANPNALLMANSCFEAVVKIGWPEARIILSQCAIYLALSAKSNSAYAAINAAMAEVQKGGDYAVPLHLRNAPTQLMKDLNYGADYAYAHSYKGQFVDQEYLPNELSGSAFYQPAENEKKARQFLQSHWPKYGYTSEEDA